MAEWAGSAPGQSVLVTLGALTVEGLLVLAAVRAHAELWRRGCRADEEAARQDAPYRPHPVSRHS